MKVLIGIIGMMVSAICLIVFLSLAAKPREEAQSFFQEWEWAKASFEKTQFKSHIDNLVVKLRKGHADHKFLVIPSNDLEKSDLFLAKIDSLEKVAAEPPMLTDRQIQNIDGLMDEFKESYGKANYPFGYKYADGLAFLSVAACFSFLILFLNGVPDL